MTDIHSCVRVSGVGVAQDVGNDAGAVRPRGEGGDGAFRRQSADRDQRRLADRRLPGAEPGEPLRRKFHLFQKRRIDRPERDIVGGDGQRPVAFGFVMGRNADPDAGAAQRRNIGPVEIALAEMDEIAAFVDREPPIIVDDELRPVLRADVPSCRNLRARRRLIPILRAQLHEPDALRQQAGQPSRVVDDEIEGIELQRRHCPDVPQASLSKGRPMTGVEGSAMSRGVIGSARKPSRPASIARAKARAIRTGSPARETAVLSSTAS